MCEIWGRGPATDDCVKKVESNQLKSPNGITPGSGHPFPGQGGAPEDGPGTAQKTAPRARPAQLTGQLMVMVTELEATWLLESTTRNRALPVWLVITQVENFPDCTFTVTGKSLHLLPWMIWTWRT